MNPPKFHARLFDVKDLEDFINHANIEFVGVYQEGSMYRLMYWENDHYTSEVLVPDPEPKLITKGL